MPPIRRFALAGSAALAILSIALFAPRHGRGQSPGPAPVRDLLKTSPFDRITLIDGTIVDVEPLSPRPLPPYDPARDDTAKAPPPRSKEDGPPPEGNVFLEKKAPPRKKGEPPAINELVIHRLDGDVRDYKVRRAHIRDIAYYEDLLLDEADRLVLAREFARAFEHALTVKLRDPSWRGLQDHLDRLLFAEGAWSLASDPDRGLRLLREVRDRRPDFPGLGETLGEAYGSRIDRAFKAGAFRDGRRVLRELTEIAPDSARTGEARARFLTKARALAAVAAKAEGAAKVDAWAEVLGVWPEYEGAAAAFEAAFRAEPTLDVGVVDLPRPVAPWVRSPASARVARLLYRPILGGIDEDSLKGANPDQVAAVVEVNELGRRLGVSVRGGLPWSDGSRPVAAMDLVRALSDRAEPRSPAYDARWDDLLDRVEATEPDRVEIRLTRAPLIPLAWLLGPIGPAHAGWDGWVSFPGGSRRPVGDGPYRWDSASGTSATYRIAEPASAGSAKIRRIRETRFPGPTAALGALVRGEITLLEHVPPDRLADLAREPEIRVGTSKHPSLHWIAIDGRNPDLRNRALRRAMIAAIDRRTILEDGVLRRPIDPRNTPTDGPFPIGSYADAPGVRPIDHDPLTARALVAAARKEVGRAIALTLEYPPRAEARRAIPRIVEALRVAGVTIRPVERPESEIEEGLRSGRRFDLAYRVGTCPEPATAAGPILCPGYDAPPAADGLGALASPRMRQLLLQLEHAGDWPSARSLLLQVDRECRDELPILPLWQLEDHRAWRARLRGPRDASSMLYEGIETWEVDPWFAPDPR